MNWWIGGDAMIDLIIAALTFIICSLVSIVRAYWTFILARPPSPEMAPEIAGVALAKAALAYWALVTTYQITMNGFDPPYWSLPARIGILAAVCFQTYTTFRVYRKGKPWHFFRQHGVG